MESLEELRAQLALVDQDIVRLAARRQRLARQVGELKDRDTSALRDYSQEKLVLDRARQTAEAEGISPDLATGLISQLIASSLTAQERQRVQSRRHGAGQRALVIGGAGRMGGWFARFLDSQGFAVEVADPARTDLSPFPGIADWAESGLDQDVIVVAAPLRASAAILDQLAGHRFSGVLFDIGSLKSPLAAGLRRLAQQGGRVTSLHPMFGPDTELLSGRHVVLVDLGVPSANDAARALFGSTMAEVVTTDLESHDRVIAQILGVSHALNIGFMTALAGSGELAGDLARLSSTTFDRQFAVAAPVAGENPRLYFEIQHLNPYGLGALDLLCSAFDRIRSAVRAGNEAEFVSLMETAGSWVRARRRRNESGPA